MRISEAQLVVLGALIGVLSLTQRAEASFNWFGKNKGSSNAPAAASGDSSPAQPAAVQADEVDDDEMPPMANVGAPRIDLATIREAKNEHKSFASSLNLNRYPGRVSSRGLSSAGGKVQGRRNGGGAAGGSYASRQKNNDNKQPLESVDELDEVEEPSLDELDEEDEIADESAGGGGAAAAASASSSGKPWYHNVKYVGTRRSEPNKEARQKLMSRINYQRAPQDEPVTGAEELAATSKKKAAGLTSKKVWGKALKGMVKATNKGLQATAKAIADLPKEIGGAMDTVSAYLQLDSRGKILALIQEAEAAAKFVRKEFSKFTLMWSPIMEQALDFLGDSNLDKVTWNDSDELDLRHDALHSLVAGYEFMRLMIIWRENLLLAHEGFKFWLEGLRDEAEKSSLNVDKDLRFTPPDVHNYMLLMAWDSIQYDSLEPRLNLEYLMDDSTPKNYESKFFRNIVVLQELYFPTINEINTEREEVRKVVEDQDDTADFYMEFRDMVAANEIKDVDVLVPQELTDKMNMLTKQLRNTKLIYDKGHLKTLKAELIEAAQERERMLSESNQKEDSQEA